MATIPYRAPACLSCASSSPMACCSDFHASTHQLRSLPLNNFLPQSSGRISFLTPVPMSPEKELKGSRHIRKRRGKNVVCLYSGNTTIVTAVSWKGSVMNNKLPVLVEFFATWCGPCRMVDRIIDEIAEEYVGKVQFFKLNTDFYPQLANDHSIDRIPTVLLFKDGKQIESITGTMPKHVYVNAIERSLEKKHTKYYVDSPSSYVCLATKAGMTFSRYFVGTCNLNWRLNSSTRSIKWEFIFPSHLGEQIHRRICKSDLDASDTVVGNAIINLL